MRLLSLNVALFEKNNLPLTTFLKNHPIDLACFQEVAEPTDNLSDPEYHSKTAIDLGTRQLKSRFYAPAMMLDHFTISDFHQEKRFHVDFGGFLNFGLYVKSKYTLNFGKLVFIQNQFSLVTDNSRWPDEQYRAIQVVDLIVNSKPLRLINYHGFWSQNKLDSPQSLQASDQLINLARETDKPVIICGDFNLFPQTVSIQKLNRQFINLSEKFKINSTRPQSNELSAVVKRNVVDYIFTDPRIKINNFQVSQSEVSDHLPLLLDFNIDN